ncbi:enoyl-CoA hydratase/isomerase family protein [Mycolicibacterium hassiacum DSM 44199]|jgi:enoyl-CoA hydratase/carnithine racemase|uniref:Enoyl-CoA hydratase/isomerase family protein n=1 Tax=Mycolicibacterium hassiacum (strain DSM 44199 / CIP 105218 / JCM 12690 / 3849) TaxID=1122247 RepID=K5BD15_MYCHD|nr:enoyl-CoA hydratase [Mycolicibacterium hassiacum]EKF21196.1 enoyl-CoA hydratase/isomerase family protein [Mycolicibacterium hassiacum DSM 44199]MBX5487388.1 enoyl-CoA hydratase [Mycolicibacterium hassiacum]MDA4086419.1 enoyl-CoA hydratase [Mycolicibacterium hassiacum DSM 44199]VCT91394.1 Short-chain-enoyl-CoA hydratase [Mycolicibacterium hassiacum DSM 44199]
MADDDLLWSVRDGVGTITLNRPESRNAFTFPMIRRWAQILRDAKTDDDVRVIVLTGAGDKAFCSGVDLSAISNANPDLTPLQRKQQLHDEIHRVALALEDLDKPVIASINGVAVGAGLDMALMCDLRIMSVSARVSEGYVKVGLTPGDGGAYYLPRIVGTAKALELLLTGDFIDAHEALRIGLVNRIAEPENLQAETLRLARSIADHPPITVRMIKRATYQSANTDLRTALDLISSHFAVVAATEDAAEALRAMQEKRTPHYRGR